MIESENAVPSSTSNNLFPIFLKLEQFRILIVGGGAVALEKLNAVLTNSPATKIKIVALTACQEIKTTAAQKNSTLVERAYQPDDLNDIDFVIVAVNDKTISRRIYDDAKAKGILVNVADTPELCDFYLSSVVKKGNLKIAISTNGKSPIIAKRLKENYEALLPNEIDGLIENMHAIRGKLNGDLASRIVKLKKITEPLATNGSYEQSVNERRWKRIASYLLVAFFSIFVGDWIHSYFSVSELAGEVKKIILTVDAQFYWMIVAGFFAQLVDGLLGMGYGVICTTTLLSLGINLPAISGSIHTAEMFSSGVSGYSHYKFGNVNKALFKKLLLPGVIGAVAGAFLLAKFGTQYAIYIRPMLAVYTLFLGTKILRVALQEKRVPKKVKRVGWLAGMGGFLDSFGGGGWGPLVTSTLISKGRSPQYVIGSVSITEFFVTLASAITFFSMLGINHWQVIVGLIIGGTTAAPFAAKLAGKLPMKSMFIGVGMMVVIWSLFSLYRFLF